jgi:plasmid stability protein
MAALNVRNLDDALLDALKQRAARHRRSLQKEVLSILEAAAFPRRRGQPAEQAPLRLHTVKVGAPTSYSRDDLYDDDAR